MFRKKILAVPFVVIIMLYVNRVSAQVTYVWSGGTSGTWNTPGNWKVGGVTQVLNYPGSNIGITNDIASIPTSNSAVTTLTFTGIHTIGQVVTTGYSSHSIAIVLSGATTVLTVSGGMSIVQQNGVMVGLALSGAGSIAIGGTFTLGYQQSMTIASGTTVSFTSGSIVDLTGNQGTITNNGTVNFTSGTLQIGSSSAFLSPGTVIGNNSTFTITTTPGYISYGSKFVSNSCTFNIPSHGYLQSTSSSSVFTATTSTFNMTGSGGSAYIDNNGTYRDHGSTYLMSGQGAYIQNEASSNMHFSGSNINFSSSAANNSEYISNAGTFIADSASVINVSTFMSYISNTGTFTAGTSASACVITVSGQGANIANTGTFYLGTTSIIYPSGYLASITNTSPGVFTLQSDANGSASIGSLSATATCTGTFNVQRYFQGSTTFDNVKNRWLERGYRILSSPVHNTAQYSSNNVSGLSYIVGATAGQTTAASSTTNAFISGCTGGNTTAGNPSVYLFKESLAPSNSTFVSGNFLGVTNISNSSTTGTVTCSDGGTYSLPSGTGVLFFFRGAATNWATRTANPFIAPESVILTSVGNINQQGVTVKDWYTPASSNIAYTGSGLGGNHNVRGFNMIGNPYPCSIDWNSAYSNTGISRVNVNPTIYVFNSRTYQYDAYITTSASTGTGTGNATNIIASGQGFFVQANNTNPSISFAESAKAATSLPIGNNLLMGTPNAQVAGSQHLRLKLGLDSLNYDDLVVNFNSSASANYNPNEDAAFLKGNGALEGFSSFSDDSVKLAVNSLPLPGVSQRVIKLDVQAHVEGTYTIQLTALGAIPKLYDIWLMDNNKKDSLDIRNNDTYAFDVSFADTTSYGPNRFELVIRQNPALMVHLLSFNGTKVNNASQIVWTTENEENYTNFTVERSNDGGATFKVIGSLSASGQTTYSMPDNSPLNGANLYRLKIQDLNGAITYSNVVTLTYNGDATAALSNITVYPNPSRGVLNVAIKSNYSLNLTNNLSALQAQSVTPSLAAVPANTATSSYGIKIVNITGSVLKSVSTASNSWQDNVGDLMPGTYIIEVVNNKDNSVVGKSSFVKL